MVEQCDCLNECGDDPRVGLYQVEPCPGALRSAKRQLANLQAEVDLREAALRYRALRAMHRHSGPFAVIRNPARQARPGADCPSLERLDAELDAYLAEFPEVLRG